MLKMYFPLGLLISPDVTKRVIPKIIITARSLEIILNIGYNCLKQLKLVALYAKDKACLSSYVAKTNNVK